MVLENIKCPICGEIMMKFKNKYSVPISVKMNIGTDETIVMPINYLICQKCHNLQTFAEFEQADVDKLI